MIKNNIKKLWLCLACMLSLAYVSAQKADLTSPFMASHYGVAIQGACIYSESWNNLPEGEFTLMGRMFKILIILMSNLSPKYPPN